MRGLVPRIHASKKGLDSRDNPVRSPAANRAIPVDQLNAYNDQ